MHAVNQEIQTAYDVRLFVKREDLIFPELSGNKYRKLKYNLIEAQRQGFKTLLTFGGAFSNHIAAVAAAGKEFGFRTIGVIRGDEVKGDNPTLKQASANGMTLHFVSREQYREKDSDAFISSLKGIFGEFYLIPEGGTNTLAIRGCAEILSPEDAYFDYICCAVGTGGTISGLIEASAGHQTIIGFSALKGDFLHAQVSALTAHGNWRIETGYSFGGYAKTTAELIGFMNDFYAEKSIPTDPVYTGKLFFGVMDMIKKGCFEKGSRILVIHTGGLQGIAGMNARLQRMNLPLIHYV